MAGIESNMGFSWGMPSIFGNHNYLNAPMSLAERTSSIFRNQVQGQMSPIIPNNTVIGQVNPNYNGNVLIGNNAPPSANSTPITVNNSITPTNGVNQYGQQLYNGGTVFDWAGIGLSTAFNIWNGINQYKGLKLAKQNFEEQKKLNHANYRMQAKAYNSNLRNQQSGRGYVGMSGSAVRELGREYNENKADKDY